MQDATLRTCHARGDSFSLIASQINAQFSTRFSRNAVIGRAARIGLPPKPLVEGRVIPLAAANRPKVAPKVERLRSSSAMRAHRPRPQLPRDELEMRCDGIDPLNIPLMDLASHHCRYPYGDHIPYRFCGHPKTEGSSYCWTHFALTLGAGTLSERAATR